MKRWVFALVLGLLGGLATDAAAVQTRLGLSLSTDVYWSIRSGSSYQTAGLGRDVSQPDLTTNVIQVGDGQLYLLLHSDDRTTGAHIQLGLTAGPVAGNTLVTLTYLYAWYKFGRLRLEVGHTDNLFGSPAYAPYGALAFAYMGDGSGGFAEFGKFYSGRFAQVALYCDVGRWTFMAALGLPSINSDNDPYFPDDAGGNRIFTNMRYPRLDLAVEYRGRHFALAPALSVYRTDWETNAEDAGLQDTYIWSWAVVLPFKVVFGDFGFTGEIGHGRNWVAPSMLNTWQYASWWSDQVASPSVFKVADTKLYSACLGLFYRVGRSTLWLSGGWQMTQNGSSDAPGSWRHGQNVRYAVILAAPTRINRHFTIAPEIGYYYYGWNPTEDMNTSTNDLGSAWIMGVRFGITF